MSTSFLLENLLELTTRFTRPEVILLRLSNILTDILVLRETKATMYARPIGLGPHLSRFHIPADLKTKMVAQCANLIPSCHRQKSYIICQSEE